jgi:branched-chain amino acid transport system permease protein
MPFFDNLANALVLASTYILIAMGLTMIYGVLKVLHIAHAAVYTIGAFVGLVIYRQVGNFWLSLVVAMVVTGVVGVIIYRVMYYHMLAAPRTVALISSIGLFIMLQDLLQKDYLMGPYKDAFPAKSGLPRLETPWFDLSHKQTMILVVAAVLLVAVYLVMNRTKIGLGWQASSMDMDMAAAVGVNLDQVIALNFFIGSALAGAAGVLVGVYYNSVFATMGDVPSYKAFIIIVLGGMGSVPGTIVASLLLALVETYLVATVGFVLPRDAIAFLVLIFMLMFRPHGLLGRE